MTGGHQRWDGWRTSAWCAAVLAGVLSLDAALERWDAATLPPDADARQAGRTTSPSAIPDVEISGFQFVRVLPKPEAKPLWILTASTAALYERRQEADLQVIRAAFQPDEPSSRVVLISEQGRFDLKGLNFEVSSQGEPVTMELAERYRLTTSRLTWNNAAAQLTSDRPVMITGEGLTVSGVGFEWTQPTGTAAIAHDVRTVITP